MVKSLYQFLKTFQGENFEDGVNYSKWLGVLAKLFSDRLFLPLVFAGCLQQCRAKDICEQEQVSMAPAHNESEHAEKKDLGHRGQLRGALPSHVQFPNTKPAQGRLREV